MEQVVRGVRQEMGAIIYIIGIGDHLLQEWAYNGIQHIAQAGDDPYQ